MKKTLKNILTYILTSLAFMMLSVGFLTSQKTATAHADDVYYTVSFDTSALYSEFGITLNIPSQTVRAGEYATRPTELTSSLSNHVQWWGDEPDDFNFDNTPIESNLTMCFRPVGSSSFHGYYSGVAVPSIYVYKVGNDVVKVHIGSNPVAPTVSQTGYTFTGWEESQIDAPYTVLTAVSDNTAGSSNSLITVDTKTINDNDYRYFSWEGFLGFTPNGNTIYTTTNEWVLEVSCLLFGIQVINYQGKHYFKLLAEKDGGGFNYVDYKFGEPNNYSNPFETNFRSQNGVWLKVVFNRYTGILSLFVKEENNPNNDWVAAKPAMSNVDWTATSSQLVPSESRFFVDISTLNYKIKGLYDLTTDRIFSNQKVRSYDIEPILYTANLQQNFTVTYVVDGSTYQTETVAHGSTATLPTPTKAHYTFTGWQVSGDNTLYGANNPYTVTDNVTLTAQFTETRYTVTFISDGVQIGQTTGAYYGGIATAAGIYTAPTKNGYNLVGWVDSNNNSVSFPLNPSADITVYAVWEEIYYTISFYVDNVLVGTAKDYQGATADELWPADPIKTGYTFNYWSPYSAIDYSTGLPVYDIVSDTRLDAVFTVNTYTVTYTVDDNTYQTETVAYGNYATLPTPTIQGYIFNGWAEKGNYGHVLYGGNTGRNYIITRDIIFEADIEEIFYTVTYVVDGSTIDTELVMYGSTATLPTPTKAHYTFSGWQVIGDNTLYGANNPYTVTDNVTFTAQFTANTYGITYLQRVNNETVLLGYQTATYGATINYLTASDLNEGFTVPEGYTFTGWEDIYGHTPTTVTGDIELYAVFTINTYTITYKVDGEVYDTVTINHGAEISYPTAPKKAGYTFVGWRNAENKAPTTATGNEVFNAVYKVDTTSNSGSTNDIGSTLASAVGFTLGFVLIISIFLGFAKVKKGSKKR